MRRILLSCLVLLSVSIAPLCAEGPFGLGVVLGAPTGLSAAYRLNETNTIQGSAAWSFVGNEGMTLTADYLYHFDNLLKIDTVTIPLYAGIGGKVNLPLSDGSDFGLGLRIPLGCRWLFREVPLEVFLEVVPGLRFIPDTDFDADAGIGIRWYF